MGKIFGTDGVRGIVNRDLSCELAFNIGVAGAYALTDGDQGRRERILIGRDTRVSCDMLEGALVAGICSLGAQAVCVGVLPTPALAYLTRHLDADAGVMISASHNPVEYNGIKWVDKNGFKLPDEMEERIELSRPASGTSRVRRDQSRSHRPPRELHRRLHRFPRRHHRRAPGRVQNRPGLRQRRGVRGGAPRFPAAGRRRRRIRQQARRHEHQRELRSTHPQNLQGWVVENGADIGLAFDGDADRLIAVDAGGHVVDGDRVMAICALDMKRRGY